MGKPEEILIFTQGNHPFFPVYLGKIRKGEDGNVMFWTMNRGMTVREVARTLITMIKLKIFGVRK